MSTVMNVALSPAKRAPAPAVAKRAAQSPIDLPSPRPGEFWRHPRRFIRSRLRLLFGSAISSRWGLDRGLPAHRYYVNLFLTEFAADIRGACLEFDDRNYLDRFGGEDVESIDVLHVDDSNPRATVIADLTAPNDVSDDTYDCIICTHVLHVIPDVPAAIRGLHRILKPGGVLLCAVPHVSAFDEREGELWRFTRLGLEMLLAGPFGIENVDARGYGNTLVAAGEIRGLIADEFTWKELHSHDPWAPVEICARAVKR
jgi:SAM-dependent methyltransferase